jgi:hypothetical protein
MITFRKEVWKDNRLIEDPTDSLKEEKGDERKDLLLVDSRIHYESWALPVAGSHNRLLAAKELIDRKKLAKALDTVEAVITDVDTFDLTVESPLWKVRGLVSSARVAVAEGDESSAGQALAEAQKRLAKIIDPAPDQSKLDPSETALAKALRTEIGALRKIVSDSSADKANKVGALRGLVRRVWAAAQHWRARHRVSSQLDDLKDDLSDALVALDWATTYQFIDKDAVKVAKERQKASEAIDEALTVADAANRPLVAAARKKMDDILHASTADDDSTVEILYADLVVDLRKLIFEIIW